MHEFYVLVILFFIVARLIKIESFAPEIALILNLKFLGIKSRACIFEAIAQNIQHFLYNTCREFPTMLFNSTLYVLIVYISMSSVKDVPPGKRNRGRGIREKLGRSQIWRSNAQPLGNSSSVA